jgi:hypothetical protein
MTQTRDPVTGGVFTNGAAHVIEQATQAPYEYYYQKLSWGSTESGALSTDDLSAYREVIITVIGVSADSWSAKMYTEPTQTTTSLIVRWVRQSTGIVTNGASSFTGNFILATGTTGGWIKNLPMFGLEFTRVGTTDGAIDIHVFAKP